MKMIRIIIVVIVIGGVYYLTQKPAQPTTQPPVTEQLPTAQPQAQAEANTIAISNFAFVPATLTIKQGTKVAWTNNDSTPHTIKSSMFNSTNLNQGDTFGFTFTTKGTFDYSCGIHPSMTGKIIVE